MAAARAMLNQHAKGWTGIQRKLAKKNGPNKVRERTHRNAENERTMHRTEHVRRASRDRTTNDAEEDARNDKERPNERLTTLVSAICSPSVCTFRDRPCC